MVIFKKTKLKNAIERGDTQGVKEMLDLGVNPDHKDQFGRSFLNYAVQYGNRDAAKLLIEKGAVVEAELHPYEGSLIHMAALKGSTEIAALLLEKNPALLQLKDRHGNTALHVAAEHGYAEFIELMIKQGLDPNQKNFSNRTPLALAQKAGQIEASELLKAYAPVRAPVDTAFGGIGETEQPAAAPAPVQDDGWKKLPGERIARIAVEETIGYRITEIFNFSAREKTTLYHNLETKSETVETRGFADLGDKGALEAALAELQKRGGRSDAASINGIEKKKLGPTP